MLDFQNGFQFNDLQSKIDALQKELDDLKARKRDAERVQFNHVVAYHRQDRDAWIVRLYRYGQKHIEQFDTRDEAVELAKMFDEVIQHVLTYRPQNDTP